MKILYHHRTLSRDGQSVHIEELIRSFRALGHDVRVVGPEQYADTSFGSDGGIVEQLKALLPRALYEILELAYNVPAFIRLYRMQRAFRPDVIYERYNLFMHAGVWLKWWTGVPLILEVNAPLAEERIKHGGLQLQTLTRSSQKRIWRGADRVLPVTAVLGKMVQDYGVEAHRLSIIPNGVGPEFMGATIDTVAAKHRLGIDADLVLGFVGFMRPWHGLERVVDFIADSQNSRIHFLVVGEGPARAEIEDRARARGVLGRVTFAGLVPREQIVGYISAFDIALQPDVVSYASPLKLFEYMALSKATVAPATENICEILSDGSDALLFDPAAEGAFRSALRRLAEDSDLRQRVGAGARQTLLRRDLTWHGNARRISAMIEALGRP